MGGDYEHISFLYSQALELQGEVQKAFLHALIYKSLDPQVFIKNSTFYVKKKNYVLSAHNARLRFE